MHEKLKKPNWKKWKEQGNVTIMQAIFLSLDIEPDPNDEQFAPDSVGISSAYPEGGEIVRRYMSILMGIKLGSLPIVNHFSQDVDPKKLQFKLEEFGRWATKKGWTLRGEYWKGDPKERIQAENPSNKSTSFNTDIERMPRWKFWEDLENVSTSEATYLSLNLEPWSPFNGLGISLEQHFLSLSDELRTSIEDRARQVASFSTIEDENNLFRKVEAKRPDLPDWKGNFVRLVDFGQGALKKGWNLPKGFPLPDDSTSTLSQGKTNSKRSGTFDSYQKIANEIYKNCKPGEKLPRSVQKEVALAIDEFHGKTIEETNAGGSPTARGIAASCVSPRYLKDL